MKNDKIFDALHACIDALENDLQGSPLHIDRDGEDYVLVAASTYGGLLQRIYDLEHELQTDDERDATEEFLLRKLSGESVH